MAPRLLAALCAFVLLSMTACGGGGNSGDPESFDEFAEKIARAAEDGDTSFFVDRVQGDVLVCTEELAAQRRCSEIGAEFQQVLITHFGVSDTVAPVEELTTDIESFFRLAQPDREDSLGSGAVRLHSMATRQPYEGWDDIYQTAFLTAILDTSSADGRYVRGIDFEYVDGRWLIRSLTTANPAVAFELLQKSSAEAMYSDWRAY